MVRAWRLRRAGGTWRPGQKRVSVKDRISAEVGIPRSAEDGAAGFQGRLNETMVEFRDVGTPACTRETERLPCVDGHRAAVQEKKKEMGHRRSYREQQPRWWCWRPQEPRCGRVPKTKKRERAQTADHVVVRYLDRRARAPTVNRRSRSGVGGARRGVREYGAVNYHKVEV